MEFAKVYNVDMPSASSLMWEMYWRKEYKGELPGSTAETYPMRASYPNIYYDLCILATIPVTSCECERSISVLRRLKTYLRNTMEQDRLNGLTLSIHRDIPIKFDDVITHLARQHLRRIELLDIMDDQAFLQLK